MLKELQHTLAITGCAISVSYNFKELQLRMWKQRVLVLHYAEAPVTALKPSCFDIPGYDIPKKGLQCIHVELQNIFTLNC